METLNHHHLYHFWMVVREGGVTRASEKLNVSQPTISGQLRELEQSLGEKLLARSGRTLVLTDIGRIVYRYADEMLGLDRELLQAVKGRPAGRGELAVGVAMVVPKLVAYQMLEPALKLPEPIQLVCVQKKQEHLIAELATYGLDVVLADAPAQPAAKVRASSQLLGECGVSVYGTERMAAAHRRGFPRSLDGAPFLLPSEDSALRLSLEDWFQRQKIRPRIVGTFEDSALLHTFGQAGAGLFALPAAIETEVRRQYRVRAAGRLDTVRQRFYAITVERKLQKPAVMAIAERGQALFG